MTDSIELERYSQSVVSETSRPYSRSASPSQSPRPDGEHDEYPEGGRKAYTVLFGSFIGLVSNLGIIGSIGAIQAYVSTHQLKGVKTSTVSWIFSIYLALSYAIGLFIGPVFDRRGPKGLLLCATVLVTAGFLATANSTNVWQLILSLSICVGVGNALAMTPLIGVVNHWFFVKRGNATGIATSGGSVGGLAIPLMLRYLYEKYSFEWAIRILAFFSLGCMVVALLLVEERVRYTKEDAPEVAGSNPPQPQNGRFARWVAATTQSVRTTLATLKDPKYSYLICGAFCGELALILVVTFFATYAIAQGVSESTSYVLLSVWNCTGILGRWLPGYLSDRFGKFNVNILMLLGLDVCIFVIWLPFGQSLKALYVFVSFGGFFSGSILSMMPTCLGQISPVREFGHRYGLLLFFLSLGNLFGVPLGATIIGDGSQHNYDMFVVLVGALCSVGLFFWVVSRYCIVGLRVNVKV